MKITRFVVLLFAALIVALPVSAAAIPTVPVGNPGNPADTRYDATGFGSVGGNYAIGKTEVTNAQYTEFLNGVAASDPYALYNTIMSPSPRAGSSAAAPPAATCTP